MKFTIILVVLLSFTSSRSSSAQDMKTWRLSLGAGIAVKKNLRVGNMYERLDKKTIIVPIPFVQAGYGRVSLGPQGLSVMALGNHVMNVSAFINRGGDRYNGLGMNPRKDSFFAGVSAKFIKYGVSVAHDINGRSKGFIAKLDYSELFLISPEFVLRMNASLDWYDDHYAEYYYAVRDHEATTLRKAYHLNNYFQPGIGVMPIYKITEKISVISALNFKLVPKKMRQSPTMNGDELEIGGLLGMNYTF